MPNRLPILKLASSPVQPLRTKFDNALLNTPATWPQDVNYLRDTYMEIHAIWEQFHEPEQDQQLYDATEPLLRELVIGLEDVAKQLSSRLDVYQDMTNAHYDFNVAGSYARAGDYAMASVYLSYALLKINRLLESLSRAPKKRVSHSKKAYGYDVSGEVNERGGTSGQDNSLSDMGAPQNHWETSKNPVTMGMTDSQAEADFPELAEFKHKRVQWPARTR